MSLRRKMLIAVCLMPLASVTAMAQFQPPAQPQAEPPPCIKGFLALRDDASKKASAIHSASEHHAPANVACKLFNEFTAAEAKMIKYAEENTVWCGIPAEVVTNIKAQHVKSTQIRTRVCQAAAAPQRPAGPSLSDALGAPVPDSKNIKTGHGGTYDTLTGTPLGK